MENIRTIPLKDAHCCLSCSAINSVKTVCQACGETYLWPLAAWINQNTEKAA